MNASLKLRVWWLSLALASAVGCETASGICATNADCLDGYACSGGRCSGGGGGGTGAGGGSAGGGSADGGGGQDGGSVDAGTQLIGIGWPTNTNVYQLRALDPASGRSALVAAIRGNAVAVDPTQRLLYVAVGIGGGRTTLETIDARTGSSRFFTQLVTNDDAGAGWPTARFFVRSDGALLAMATNTGTDAGTMVELRQVDRSNGTWTVMATYPTLIAWGGAQVIDRAHDVIYLSGFSDQDFHEHLFTIAAGDGGLLASPMLHEPVPLSDGGVQQDPSPYNWSGGMHVRSDGTLVGLTGERGVPFGGLLQLRSIDIATGSSAYLRGYSTFGSVSSSTLVNGDLYAIVWLGTSDRLVTIDAASGSVKSSTAISGYDAGGVEYRWPGLFSYDQ